MNRGFRATLSREAAAAVARHVSAFPPERGGMLFGDANSLDAMWFELDGDGETSSVSYVPSAEATRITRRIESTTSMSLVGILHSHPEWLCVPSSADIHSFSELFACNPHLQRSLAVIVTHEPASAPHEAPLPSRRPSKACFFVVERSDKPKAIPVPVSIV
jgi:proteasome lid subunit RPN8/RPN11